MNKRLSNFSFARIDSIHINQLDFKKEFLVIDLTNEWVLIRFRCKPYQTRKKLMNFDIDTESQKKSLGKSNDSQRKQVLTGDVPAKILDQGPISAYDPAISRKLMEGICGLSTNTLVKYESEGIIHPQKVKHGGLEVVTYRVTDVQAVLKRRGVQFNKKKSAEVISIFSQKGGVGKSAFAQHLGGMLSLVGKVLVIDLDSQSDVTSLFGLNVKFADLVMEDAELDPTIAELMDWHLKDGHESPYRKLPFDAVVKRISPTLHVIPADLDLGEINYSLNRLPLEDQADENGDLKPAILYMIKDVVDKVKDQYDFILFDCPPNIETCNVNALFASNRIIIPLELEAKCLKTMRRNEDFLRRLRDIHPGFDWDKILVVPNKFRRENIKIKALAKLQDIYFERSDVQLSEAVFPNGAIIDRCSESREPVFVAATRYGKEFKAGVPQAKEFTNYFWVVMHEILDLPIAHLIFPENPDVEA
jgi:chromosome partitioning protein